ncbi:signal transduction histidine kinase [Sphaerochaeta pleomorpha str. Grapes]|uniref:histidine kinase n=1 Tax=Sphaerochaeta pleomorpha (strain ATCC BAA-1885 / DSM 22778 / Grapes) TaxID=158190 RepID=G8QRR3_SPHPG|nr:HAMP domain-containing sensor histidine kinase [Sphaerochaeta pleomorpha]AEV28846.1 signal transduction histidine kinase [Sphaerochaeta pleomorpha str. Grapes]
MRKQFFRLFFGFVAVVAVFLAIQIAVFFFNGERQRKEWTDTVFQEYLETFSSRLEAEMPESGWSIANIIRVLVSSADDRVSGLYLRNPDGSVAVAFGKTRRGDDLPQNSIGFKVPAEVMFHDGSSYFGNLSPASKMVDKDGFTSVKQQSEVYSLKIINLDGVVSTMKTKQKSEKSETILLPPEVRASDIAGSFNVIYNNETICNVDVLTFTPFTYKSTSRLLFGLMGPFLWSIPLAVLISLMMAASLSRKGEQYTKGIQSALGRLSSGENGVSLPDTKIDEQLVINESIRQLDDTLLRNKESRQVWLRGISHDLNTPVTSMKLALDGIVDGVFPLNEETIAMIKKENDELSERIASVVLYANLQSPDAKAIVRSFDSQEFVESVLDQFSPQQNNLVTVKYGNPALQGDEALLQKATQALLSNAIQSGAKAIVWEIRENSMIISNDGVLREGVDFFEPWTRGDVGRSTGGSGLGLPIVNQIMRLHGGKATIEQKGKTVVVTLKW